MSLLPYLLEMDRSRRLANQQIALALGPEEILALVTPQYSNELSNYRNWKQVASALHDVGSTIKSDYNKFQINLDVQHFAPEEISVKTADGFVVIQAKHEEKKDNHGWVSRQFVRRYPLPDGCNIDTVQSRLSSDGVLTVTAPLERAQTSNERIVPIVQTGPVKTRLDGTKSEGEGEGDGTASLKTPVENGQ